MVEFAQYELLDFGQGRKLERFGEFLLDRPCPPAERTGRSDDSIWRGAAARFERTSGDQGSWLPARALPDQWMLECGCFRLQLRPTPFGHVGVFPEQLANWRWLHQQITPRPRPFRILNLFAYTGGSTLAAAAAGAEVVHVDAARNVVRWARENARLSGLQDKPIRWITEDARKFVSREQKRGNQYHALILDPPSYGHGPRGESWKLSQNLLPLLRMCSKILLPTQPFVLLTCHSPGFGPAEVAACLSEGIFGHCQVPVVSHSLCLTTRDGRRLPAGVMAHGVGNVPRNPAD